MVYQDWGDPSNPDVVVCVHGLTRISDDFCELAQALADRYRVILPDVVGRGRSDRLKNPSRYMVPQYAMDMMVLIKALGVPTVRWVGTSMGGLIAMALAAQPQSPISRMVLNDVGAVLSGDALARISRYLGTKTEFASYAEAFLALRGVFASFGPHSENEWKLIVDRVIRPIPGAQGFRTHYDPAIAEPFRDAYGAFGKDQAPPPDLLLWDLYDAIRCPTLLLRGATSDLLSAETAKEMTERGPRAQLVTFEGVGHAPSLMHADQIRVVRDFLA
jgi:pimeloyl-ACP methyl ester carboxylesterase